MQVNQMQHFTSFYADFGIIKQQNKANKQIFDLTGKRVDYDYNKKNPPNPEQYAKVINDNKKFVRKLRNQINTEPSSPVREGVVNPKYFVSLPKKRDSPEGLNTLYKQSLIRDYNRKLISNSPTNTDPKRRLSNLAQIKDNNVPDSSLYDQSKADEVYKYRLEESRKKKNSKNIDPLSQKREIINKGAIIDTVAPLNTEGFTDIRQTNDKAASRSGFLGFRTDPFKGMGGMMEEPITQKVYGRYSPKYSYSRVSGKQVGLGGFTNVYEHDR